MRCEKYLPVIASEAKQTRATLTTLDCFASLAMTEWLERAGLSKVLSGRRLPQRGDDVVDDFLDQDAVVALAHHADHRLGAGRAHEQPAVAIEALLAVGNRRFDLGILERLAAPVAHILQDLRQRIEAMTDFRNRAA